MSSNNSAVTNRANYWNSFYAGAQTSLVKPSQFAVFVDGECNGSRLVIDVGSGSGRDSFFFAANGHKVVGIDGSEAAVQHCTQQICPSSGDISFRSFRLGDESLVPAALAARGERPGSEVVLYARFFIHAITDEEEAIFLKLACQLCAGGGLLAVEFRTLRDQAQVKVTSDHYRRFVDPLKFVNAASKIGFDARYFVEGVGYAKYKEDDAYVARILLQAATN